MSIIKELDINNFRALRQIHYNPRQINIITGRNNTGKSALLDAIAVNVSGFINYDFPFFFNNPLTFITYGEKIAKINSNLNSVTIFSDLKTLEEKGGGAVSQEIYNEVIKNLLANRGHSEYKEIFENKDFQDEYLSFINEFVDFVVISSDFGHAVCQYFKNGDSGRKQFYEIARKLIQKYNKDKPINRTSIFRMLYSHMIYLDVKNPDNIPKVVEINHESKLEFGDISEEELIILEDFIKENNLVKDLKRLSNNDVVYQKGDKLTTIPISSHGDGFIALLNTVRYLLMAKDGILLIEEPENHLHPRYIDVFISNIFSYCQKLNVQVFMSTHSLDLIRTALNFPETDTEKDLLLVSRMTSDGDIIEKFDYSVDDGLRVTEELYLDLRGN